MSSSKAVQAMGQKGFVNTDTKRRRSIGDTKGNRLFGRIKHLVERIITVAESDPWTILIALILLIIAIVIAVLFKADMAALIL